MNTHDSRSKGAARMPLAIAIACALTASLRAGPQAALGCQPSWIASFDPPPDGAVRALAVLDVGHGRELYAAGEFTHAGGASLAAIGRWNGSIWSPLGAGMPTFQNPPSVRALAVFDDGGGAALYAGGFYDYAASLWVNGIAKWDGSNWSALTSGVTGYVNALFAYDDGSGPALYVGGHFGDAGIVPANSIARWNGSSWAKVGPGMNHNAVVNAFATFDDGIGPALYAGGAFGMAGFGFANNVAKWNGTSWSPLGSGTAGAVLTLATFDDGTGAKLYAGGSFTNAGGSGASFVAAWDGSAWSVVGGGVDGAVSSLAVFDDGNGPALFAGGSFTHAGGGAADHVAKWNGASWAPLGSGTNGAVLALASYDDSSGPALFAGGSFLDAPDSHDSRLAKWGCAFPATGASYCTSSTTSHGCAPVISALGSASASAGSGFAISVANLEGQRSALLFYGLRGQLASPWANGATSFLCVKSPTQRMALHNSGGTSGSCDGALTEDWNAYIAAHPNSLGSPFAAGDVVWAQAWFRDPPSPKTSALSNGVVFAVGP